MPDEVQPSTPAAGTSVGAHLTTIVGDSNATQIEAPHAIRSTPPVWPSSGEEEDFLNAVNATHLESY